MSENNKKMRYDLRKSANWTNAAATNLRRLDTTDPSLVSARANALDMLSRAARFIEEVRYLYDNPMPSIEEEEYDEWV